jgi:hypothetical protein
VFAMLFTLLGMSWFPPEILFLVAAILDDTDLAALSQTRKSNFDLLNPSLSGHKLFKALLDRDDELVLYLTHQPFVDL